MTPPAVKVGPLCGKEFNSYGRERQQISSWATEQIFLLVAVILAQASFMLGFPVVRLLVEEVKASFLLEHSLGK